LTQCQQCGNRVTDQQEFCSKCGRKLGAIQVQPSGFKWKYVFLGFLALCILSVFNKREETATSTHSTTSTGSAGERDAAAVMDAVRRAEANPTTTEQDLKLDFTWSKEGFDNIMEANFTIKNDGPSAIKDIEITCIHTAPSGTVIDRNTRTIYEIVKAKSKRSFPKFNMGFINSQVKSSSCGIVNFKVVD